MSGGLYASMGLCVNIDADSEFQFDRDVVISDGYFFNTAS